MPLKEVGVCPGTMGHREGPEQGRAGYYQKKEPLCVQIWCSGALSTVWDLKAPLPEEMTSDTGLEREHKWEGWRDRDFVLGTGESWEKWK